MRCTEGAWLSVTPTEEEIIVAIDFEGRESCYRRLLVLIFLYS